MISVEFNGLDAEFHASPTACSQFFRADVQNELNFVWIKKSNFLGHISFAKFLATAGATVETVSSCSQQLSVAKV